MWGAAWAGPCLEARGQPRNKGRWARHRQEERRREGTVGGGAHRWGPCGSLLGSRLCSRHSAPPPGHNGHLQAENTDSPGHSIPGLYSSVPMCRQGRRWARGGVDRAGAGRSDSGQRHVCSGTSAPPLAMGRAICRITVIASLPGAPALPCRKCRWGGCSAWEHQSSAAPGLFDLARLRFPITPGGGTSFPLLWEPGHVFISQTKCSPWLEGSLGGHACTGKAQHPTWSLTQRQESGKCPEHP